MKADREDLTAQLAAVATARGVLAVRLDTLEQRARREGATEVADEARALVKALASKAKRPPAVDLTDLLGALSAADRPSTARFSVEYDSAQGQVRDAERLLDHALYDLDTARGADG